MATARATETVNEAAGEVPPSFAAVTENVAVVVMVVETEGTVV
jgi:hypothetical protein